MPKPTTAEQRMDKWLRKVIASCEAPGASFKWTFHPSAPKYQWHLVVRGMRYDAWKMTIPERHRLSRMAPHLAPPPEVKHMNASQLRQHILELEKRYGARGEEEHESP